MMMKKILGFVVLLLLVACSRQSDKYIIGVSQCSQDVWRDKLNREMKTAEYFNDSLEVILASANDDSRKQIEQINRFVEDGVDLIVVAPNQYNSIASAIENAYDRGIPVILYDRKVNTEKYTASIGADNYGIGKAMARFVGHQLKGKGRVVEIRGLEGSSPAAERHQGFVDGLKDYPDVELVASEAGDWKEESGTEAMKKILAETRQFDYVFGHNDRMAWGAYLALREHGLEKMVRFAGVDGLATKGGGLELVRDGVFEATSIYPTQGKDVVALAMKVLHNKTYCRDNLLQTTVVTGDNAELLLMEAKEIERQNNDLDMLHGKVDKYFTQYNNQKIFMILSVGIILLMVVSVVNIYRAYATKNRLNHQLKDRNDELQRLSKEVEDMTREQLIFFTNVSHELRTPLTLIADPVDRLLDEGKSEGEDRMLLQMVQRNVNVLMRQVNEILDFRKVQNGKMQLKVSSFAIGKAFRMWCDDFEGAARHKGITLRFLSEVDEDSMILADRDKVSHIYLNLMNNALKYTPKGGTIITMLGKEHEHYIIKVRDTGVGIESEDLPHVFTRFFQAKNSTGGTGLGLAIVEAFTRLHQGEVTVESKKGEGTCFTVSIPESCCDTDSLYSNFSPKGEGNAPTGCLASLSPTGEGVGGSPLKEKPLLESLSVSMQQRLSDVVSTDEGSRPEVLIIDDNDDVRTYLHAILKEHYHVMEAVDGRQGLSVARKTVPDIVICDIMMPVMDGLEFTRQLKTDTVTSHIPVILLTARSLDEQKVEGYEYGADSYIIKPFHTKVLLARVENLLKSRQTLRLAFASAEHDGEDGNTVDVAAESAKETKMGDRDMAFVARLRELIQANLCDSDFNVERIGEEIGLSRVQLYRKVKALTGLSPVELLRTARLQRGKRLLETTDMTVSEVAYDTGFTSPSYFTKCFKDEFGQSPNEWRG